MRKRRIALTMALTMLFTSIPTNGFVSYAEDVVVEDLIIEDETVEDHVHEHDDTDSESNVVIEEVSVADNSESQNETEKETQTDAEGIDESETSEEVPEESSVSEQEVTEAAAEMYQIEMTAVVDEVLELGAGETQTVTGLSFGDGFKTEYYAWDEVQTAIGCVPVTLWYGTDTETITAWNLTSADEDGQVMEYTAQSSYNAQVTLQLYQGEKQISIDTVLSVGTYTLRALVAETELTLDQNITVQMFPETSDILTTNGSGITYAVTGEQENYYICTPDETASYYLEFTGAENLAYHVYEIGEATCNEIVSSYYTVGDLGRYYFNMESGKQYGIRLQSTGTDAYGSVSMNVQKQIKAVAFADEVTEYTALNAAEALSQMAVYVTYTGTGSVAETVTGWNETYIGDEATGIESRLYYAITSQNEAVYLRLEKDGIVYSLPSQYDSSESIPCGTYTLRICDPYNNSYTSASKTINLKTVPSDATVLQQGNTTDYDIWAGETKYWSFSVSEAGGYSILMTDEEFTYSTIQLYRVSDEKLELVQRSSEMTSNRKVSMYADAAGTYLLVMKSDSNTYGTITVNKNQEIDSVTLDIKESYNILELNYYLSSPSAVVTYKAAEGEVAATESISDWGLGTFDSETVLCAETMGGATLKLKIQDSDGNTVAYPNKFFSYEEALIQPGSYKLLVCEASSDTLLNSYSFAVTDQVCDTLKLGENHTLSVDPYAVSVYEFNPEATGYYYFHCGDDGFCAYCAFVKYDKEKEQYILTAEYDYADGRIWMEKGTAYYMVLYGSAFSSGEDVLETQYVPEITKMELVSAPDRTKYIAGLERFDAEGMSVKVSYADGSYEIVSFTDDTVARDSYDNRIWYDLYAGSTEEDIIEDNYYYSWSRLTEGDFLVVVETENGLQVVTPITVISREEASKDYPLKAAAELVLSNMDGHFVCVAFTPDKDGTYVLQSNAELVYCKINK